MRVGVLKYVHYIKSFTSAVRQAASNGRKRRVIDVDDLEDDDADVLAVVGGSDLRLLKVRRPLA